VSTLINNVVIKIMNINTQLIKNLKHWMIDENYNGSDLATFLGCSRSFVSSVIAGKKSIPESWLYKLPVKVTEAVIKEKIEHHLSMVAKLKGLLK